MNENQGDQKPVNPEEIKHQVTIKQDGATDTVITTQRDINEFLPQMVPGQQLIIEPVKGA